MRHADRRIVSRTHARIGMIKNDYRGAHKNKQPAPRHAYSRQRCVYFCRKQMGLFMYGLRGQRSITLPESR